MSRIRLKQVYQIRHKDVSDACDSFLRHCQLKNLVPLTYTYYKENLQFFFDSAPQVTFVDVLIELVVCSYIYLMHNSITPDEIMADAEKDITEGIEEYFF